ncbi:hypothetical protein MPPM_3425 [Methylorubrum populi]|uniref:Uncharacterized protein n=1 Tax=Methylorubrum populi TaxID=223967 RepID=A0A160PJS9_9HYPH|nr:hypothetical protein [Methylorubrum populi]BAU92030.1 hypothetical protein MPPM_3425 [Methylorubrum populi]
MRILRLVILAFGMLGGLAGLNATANAAPLPMTSAAAKAAESPLLNSVHWYGRRHYRRVYWRPRYHYRRAYWRPRHYHRRAYWGPRPYYRRPYWRAHYYHRPRFYRPWY